MKKIIFLSLLILSACSATISTDIYEEPLHLNSGKGDAVLLYTDDYGNKLYKNDLPKNRKCRALGKVYSEGCSTKCQFEAIMKAITTNGGNTGVLIFASPVSSKLEFHIIYCNK